MPLTPSSAKAKGRKLQQWVRDKILEIFPSLTSRDVKSTSMGAGGEDVQLSSVAHSLFPYTVECKARETFKTLYEWLYQTKHKDSKNLLFVKMNHNPVLVVMEAEHFFHLIKRQEDGRV